MPRTSFINAKIFDGTGSDYLDESVVVVDNDCIVAVERKLDPAVAGDVIDVRGKTLMPGLIDAHCHVLGSSLRITDSETQPLTYVASYASKMLGHALDCGFTTLRDVGGGDIGIARAVEDRLIKGPRVFFAGRVLSMTGGHGDFRDPFSSIGACACSADGRVAVICDGADAVRAAAREELRRGAHCIKIMLSGGVLVAHRSALDGSIYRRGSNGRGGRGRPPPQIRRRPLPSAELHRKSCKIGGQNHRARHSHR